MLRPLGPPRNRTTEVVERLRAEIASGRLPQGARLPTEQALTAALGVSRTVVREAIAALRADGFVETRHGVGVFVAKDVQRRPFRIDPDGLRSLDEVLQVMELRMAVEIEAAGIAAGRGNASARSAIARSLAAIDAALARGEPAIDEDFAFHQAIAAATGNAHFIRFHEFLGRFITPRQKLRVRAHGPEDHRAYLERFQAEHRQIAAAIRAGDAAAARQAMRRHLTNSSQRYRRLVQGDKERRDNSG